MTDELSELKNRLNETDKLVQRHDKIVWVIGILAVIFGVAGGWGAKTLSSMENRLSSMDKTLSQTETKLTKLTERVNKARDNFDKHVKVKKEEFDKYVESSKKNFDLYFEKKTKGMEKQTAALTDRIGREKQDFSQHVASQIGGFDAHVEMKERDFYAMAEKVLPRVNHRLSKLEAFDGQLRNGRLATLRVRNLKIEGGSLRLYDSNGKERVLVGTSTNGDGGIWLTSKQGHKGVQLGVVLN